MIVRTGGQLEAEEDTEEHVEKDLEEDALEGHSGG